jgi:hypothetical protein
VPPRLFLAALSNMPLRYPFVPKSTAQLLPGQFWSVPLSDGRFACGRVLQLGGSEIPTKSRAFFGGLHSWIGTREPDAGSIIAVPFLDFGAMHIRAVTEAGGKILGEAPLQDFQMPTLLSAMGGPDAALLAGADALRKAKRSEWGTLPVLGFWGYDHIREIAEQRLVKHVA